MNSAADIISIIQKSNGINISELVAQYPETPRRTLQRWINEALKENKISAQGEGRSRRYFKLSEEETHDSFPNYITISADSKEILIYLDQSLNQRHSVGYEINFLGEYQPNRTWYLSPSLRRQLHKMGNTNLLPSGTYHRNILNHLLIDLSWASSHLEGNTYSRLETKALIEQGKIGAGKTSIETQMILNHKAAIQFLIDSNYENSHAEKMRVNRFLVMNLHTMLSENLLPNPEDEGRVRQHRVEIGLSTYQPLSIPIQISMQLDIILEKAQNIEDPFEQSFFLMVHLPYLQPFADVNKRTSRLIANLPLIQSQLCPLTFLHVPESAYSRAVLGVYELNRIELLRDLYLWAYEKSTQEYLTIKQNLVEPDPMRLAYRQEIKDCVYNIVKNHEKDPLKIIEVYISEKKPNVDKKEIEALILEELRRVHEGSLARYGLRISDFKKWKDPTNN